MSGLGWTLRETVKAEVLGQGIEERLQSRKEKRRKAVFDRCVEIFHYLFLERRLGSRYSFHERV